MDYEVHVPNTIYGVAVAVLKDSKIFLSRRTEVVINPKKWQFVHGRLHKEEPSVNGAMRLVEDQMDVNITDCMRFKFVSSVSCCEGQEHYYMYLLNLKTEEEPINTCDRFRSDWRLFDLEHAETLDVLEGIRPIIRKLKKTKLKFESYKQSGNNVLTEREARALAKLGPRMTRLV